MKFMLIIQLCAYSTCNNTVYVPNVDKKECIEEGEKRQSNYAHRFGQLNWWCVPYNEKTDWMFRK